jgi:hypothetical protein
LLVGSHIHAVDLVVIRFADPRLVFDPQVAGCAGTNTATGVVKEDTEILGDIEERHRLAVVIVRHCSELEFDSLAFRLKGDPD